MTHTTIGAALSLVVATFAASSAHAQNYSNPNMAPVNDLPNPYTPRRSMPLPGGREWGSTAGVDAAKGRDDIWAIDRCGSNTCVGSHLNPLLHYDGNGNLIGEMGADLFAFPHGIHVDQEGNVWVTDPLPPDGRGAGGNVGQQVTKLSPSGEILLQLGTRKVAGSGTNQFSSPSDVVVGANGDIFVADGHGVGTTERIMKFDKAGIFIKAWGNSGNGPCGAGEFSSLHAIAIDSRGRLFIGDRDNNRIQIYDQDGNYLDCWYQFSRPSGIFIDKKDVLYSADSESGGINPAHGQWTRGVRIGSAKDGKVTALIPDPLPLCAQGQEQGNPPTCARGTWVAEGVASDDAGNIYGAEVGPRKMQKYVKK